MDGFGDEQHTTDWSFDGVYTRYHNHSYTNGDRWSSTNTSEFPPINRPRLVKIVTFWLTLILIGIICVIIYLAHIRETKTRYYISHGKLAILQEYTTALGNRDSMEYKSLTANFCNQMDKTFRKSRSYTNNYRMCVVTNLRPGSVIVTFTLYFDATVDVSDNAVLTAINDSVQQVDSKNMLGDYPIDINGLSVTTTLTLYEQDPLPFLEPNSDFTIPPTTKQTTTSTAVTSTSTILATITTAIPPVDTTETKQTTTSSTETTKVTTVMTQPTTETTKPTTTMPMTTTVETTTESHTKASTSTNTILLTSTTEPKTTTTLPSTVKTKLTTTIPLTTTTEGTTTSYKSPTTTITSTTLASTVTTKSTTTIALPTTIQDTKTTTLVPTITTEATTTTTLPPSSTTKATTTIPLTLSTEAKLTTAMSLITTVATTSLSPTTTEAKTTTTLSPSTTTEQTTTTITPTVTSEVTTRATGLPFVTTEESREELTTKSPAKPTETTVSPTLTTNKTATTISSNITSNTSTTIPVKETTEALTTIPPTKTSEAEVSTTLPTTVTTKVVTGMSSTLTDKKTITMSSPEITEGVTTIPTSKTTETTVSNTLPTTKEDTTISTNTTSNTSTTLPVKETTEALTTIPSTKTTEAEVSTTLPTTVTTRIVTSMSSTITGNKTTMSFKETTGTTTITTSSPETPERFTSKTTETTVSSILLTTKEDTSIPTNKTFNTSTISPVKETTEALTTIPPTKTAEATMSAALQTTKEAPTMSPTKASNTSTTFSLEETTEALTTIPPTKTTEAEMSTILPTAVTTKVVTSMSPTITGNSTTTFPLIETTGTLTSLTTFMSTESRGTSTMSEIITTLQSVPTSTNTDISVKSTFTTFESTSVSVENNTLSTNDTTVPPDNSAESSPDSTTTVETSSIISHKVSDNATAEPTVLPTSDISTLISTEESTLTNTTREDITEATVSNTTSDDTTQATVTNTTREVTTEATTREDITTALVTNTTEEVTTENTITKTTSEYTTEVTLNTTRQYTTETTVTNTTLEDTIETTVVNTSEYTSGTSTIATTVSPFTANVMFPSKTIFAREDTTLECVIIVTNQWEKVTMNQETENDILFLAEFYNNGSVFSQVTSEFLTVVFKQDNETIKTIININIQNMSSCPSLLYFACGIIMEDTFKSVITNTSTLSITAPLHNVTLDMATVYYSGERLELKCRTITDFEYGEVSLEVRSPSGLVHREPAPRTKYASTRNSDCSVNFEWKFKSNISLDSSLNGSTVRCIASNRLLNTSVSKSQLITVLVSEVSFSQYYVSGSVGKQVTIECKTNTLSSDIDQMAVYKTFNGTNETIAVYSNGNTNSSSDLIVTFLDGVLTLTLSSLKCSDEGLYICVVTTGSSEVSSPLFLTLQPTVLAGSTGVYMSLNIDIVKNTYRHTSEHSCFGEIGYPDANGYLSLTATHPTSGETVVYNEEVVTDAMKVKSRVGLGIYDYGVTLADDFGILVREDQKVQENCSTIHKVRFLLNVSREWSRGSIRCEIQTKEGRIPASVKEEIFYVIPSDVCDNHNKTGTFYLDHEKQDNCNTYIQCSQYPPFGKKCPDPTHCMDVQLGHCDDCERATCREIRTTTDTPTTEAMQGNGYLECNSSYVYEGESAKIGCNLNTTSFVSINVTKLNSTIASILADGSVTVYPEYQGKLTAVLSLTSLLLDITFSSVTCSDSDMYTIEMYLSSGNVTFTTCKVVMKVKPENPSLKLYHDLLDGLNSKSHSCTGYVGNPPGFLEIQIKQSSSSNFTKYSTPLQRISSSLVDTGNCSFRQTLEFSIDLSSESWSNVTMRCVAFNPMSLEATDLVPSSLLYSVTSITSNFCKNDTAEYFDYHPLGCPYFVLCFKGKPHTNTCQEDQCINPTIGQCIK